MAKNSTIELLLKIGAIASLVIAILDAIPGIPIGGWGFGYWLGGWVFDLIMGVVIVLLALALMYELGIIKKFFFKIPLDFVPLLVVGLIILVPTGNWGGIPILIAAFWDKYG